MAGRLPSPQKNRFHVASQKICSPSRKIFIFKRLPALDLSLSPSRGEGEYELETKESAISHYTIYSKARDPLEIQTLLRPDQSKTPGQAFSQQFTEVLNWRPQVG